MALPFFAFVLRTWDEHLLLIATFSYQSTRTVNYILHSLPFDTKLPYLGLNQEWETTHFRTGSPKSVFISFFRGSQSQLENQHKGEDGDAKEPQPTDSLQAGGIDRVA